MPDRVILRRAKRSLGYAYVTGANVERVQLALKARGVDISVDGIFGKDTERAVRSWQANVGRPPTGMITHKDWTGLTDQPAPDLFEHCLQITSWFEGHGFRPAIGNVDGALLTWGIIGFTLQSGELQALFEAFEAYQPGLARSVAGDAFVDKLEELFDAPSNAKRAKIVATISEKEGSKYLLPDYETGFAKLGGHKDVQKIQIERSREKYWQRAGRDAEKLGLSGDLALALCFDIAVQNGGVSASEEARWRTKTQSVTSEVERRTILADVVAEASKPQYVENVRGRKRTLATGDGVARGMKIDTTDWGLPGEGPSHEPLSSPLIGLTPRERLTSFLSNLGLKRVRPQQLTFLGGSHSNANDPAYGKNYIPAEDMWRNIVPTARVLDQLCQEENTELATLSVYRSPEYNALIPNSAKYSLHQEFNAVDFRLLDGRKPAVWRNRVEILRSDGLFDGWTKAYNSFVHIDTRGDIE